jgi:hypothetical protein
VSQEIDRLVRTQLLFREVNERVRETIGAFDGPAEFLCECSGEDCIEMVLMEMTDYDRIRAQPNLFPVVPGHELMEVDRVVDQRHGYILVERVAAADEVTRADPRSREGQMSRHERMLQNPETFRFANERLPDLVIGAGTTDHRHVPFFCECADGGCQARLNATLDEFEDAHVTSQHYFILPGHLTMDGEGAIEENGRYDVVTNGAV